jgi:MFS family permease
MIGPVRRNPSTVVILAGQPPEELPGAVSRSVNVSLIRPGDGEGIEPAAAALRRAAGISSPYVLVAADPLAAVAAEWEAMWQPGGAPRGSAEFELRAGEALAAWRAGQFELPDYYLVLAPAQPSGEQHPGFHLGPLRAVRPHRVAAVTAPEPAGQAAGVIAALASLRHGRWWPPLDDIIRTSRGFYPSALAESGSGLAASQGRLLGLGAAGGLPRPFWVLWAGTLVNRLGVFVEPFLALYLTSARHLSLGQAGAMLAAYGAGSVLSQPFGGALADRIGRRATLTGGMLANGAALIGLGYARGLMPLAATVVLAGFTIGIYRPASSAIVADLVGPRDRTRAYGLLFWAVNAGYSVAMVAGGTLARAGYGWLFRADAATCAAFGVLVWRGVPETLPGKARAGGGAGNRGTGNRAAGGFRAVLRDRLMVSFTLVTLLTMCVYMQAYTTLPLAVTRSGLSPRDYGLAMAVNGVVIMAAQPATGAWLGRLPRHGKPGPATVLACGIGAIGLGFGLTSLASATWEYAACVAIWTCGEILTSSAGPAMIAALAPPEGRGRYNGLFGLAFSHGYLIAPLPGTRLLALGAPLLWLCCAGACAVAACWQLALGPAIRRRQREQEQEREESAGADAAAVSG